MVDIKSVLAYKRIKVIDIVKKLEEKRGKKLCYASFSTRLKDGTLRLAEAEEILEVIGSRLVVMDQNTSRIFLDKNA